jgi:hypothetical protein
MVAGFLQAVTKKLTGMKKGGKKQMVESLPSNPRKLGKLLHEYYLETVKELSPESYNPDADKAWKDLTVEQRKIDIGIAERLLKRMCVSHECKKCGKYLNGTCKMVFPAKCSHYRNIPCCFVEVSS